MAILKDLIVHGSSRFLNKIYASEIQTSLIDAEAGIFKKLKANDATVVGLLDVQGQMHTNNWTNSNIATIDGSFYITPTLSSSSGTVSFNSATAATFTGTYSAVSSLYVGNNTASTVQWTSGSKILITGEVQVDGEWTPLGTLLGTLNSTNPTTSMPVVSITDNRNNSSAILTNIYNLKSNTSLNYRNLKVSLYQRADNLTYYPLGIFITALGQNGKTFLDIYGGVNTLTTSYGGYANPNVRIGNLSGLPAITTAAGNFSPVGWGIYTTNGYFSGTIVSNTGVIGGWRLGANSLYNGTTGLNNTTAGIYLGTDGIRNYKDVNTYVNITEGIITAKNVNLSGSITATSGTIGGIEIDNSGKLWITDANISGKILAKHIDVSSLSIGISQVSNLQTTLDGKQASGDYATNTALNGVSTVANTALNQSVWYAICDSTGDAVAKVATISPVTSAFSLQTGIAVNVKFNNLNSGAVANLTLNINGTGAKPIKYINNGSLEILQSADHIKAGNTYNFIYDGTNWIIQLNCNTIGSYGGVGTIAGPDSTGGTSSNTVYRYTLVMKSAIGANPRWVSLVTSNSTATSKTRYTRGLYPDEILYHATGSDYVTGDAIGTLYKSLLIDFRYSSNCGSTLTRGKPVYLVGTINDLDGLFYLDSTWWTQTEPIIEDGKMYIYLGLAYSTTQVVLDTENPQMLYYKGAFRTLTEVNEMKAAMTATSYITQIDNTGIKITPYDQSENNYLQINSSAISMYRNNIETINIGNSAVRIGKSNQNNVYIDNDSVDIRNGQTILSSFGNSTITLGELNKSRLELTAGMIKGISSQGVENFKIVGNSEAAITTQDSGTFTNRATIEDYKESGIVFSGYFIPNINLNNYESVTISLNYTINETSRNYTFSFTPANIGEDGQYQSITPSSQELVTGDIHTKEYLDMSEGFSFIIQDMNKVPEEPSTQPEEEEQGSEEIEIELPFTVSDSISYSITVITSQHYDSSFTFGSRSNGTIGANSCTIGEELIAKSVNQVVIGRYNYSYNTRDYAFQIGNGIRGIERRNALLVDWDGDIELGLQTASSTVNYNLFNAIKALGWTSEVIT